MNSIDDLIEYLNEAMRHTYEELENPNYDELDKKYMIGRYQTLIEIWGITKNLTTLKTNMEKKHD